MQFGRYETLRPIASGGMATVHLARALGAGGFERLVAIKAMHPHIEAEPEFVAMFLDEARLAARVRHPNVVATIDVHEDPLFLVMDYIEGPSLHVVLRELRKRGDLVPIGIALRLFLDLLAGLHAAHDLIGSDGQPLHLVHRDVSPHNVLIGVDGVTRITDFGVARASSRLSTTRGNQVKGKLAYMAPEQIRSQEIDRRVDVYAAGAVLWETLSGRALFRAENDAALISKIVRGATQSPRSVVSSIPPSIDDVCMRALASTPGERFASAADFADALEESARAEGIAVANTRAVATYAKELDLHEAPAQSVSSANLRPSVRPFAAPHDPALTSPEKSSPEGSSPEKSVPGSHSSERSSSSVGTLLAPSTVPEAQPRPRWPLVVGALGLVALGGAAGVVMTRDAEFAAPASIASATHSEPTQTSTSVAATVTPAAAASAASSQPSSEASSEPRSEASSEPSSEASSATTAPGAARPSPAGRRPGPTTRPPASLTSFRPDSL